MEQLQLTLTLSSTHFSSSSSSSVSSNYDEMMMMMMNGGDHFSRAATKNKIKRAYEDAASGEVNSTYEFVSSDDHHHHPPQTLSLFSWKPNGDDRGDESPENNHSVPFYGSNEDGGEKGLVGWPPVKTWRKRAWQVVSGGGRGGGNYVRVENHGGRRRGQMRNSMFVKVKMEGVGIARKVDLSLHHSYHTLTHTLLSMFGKCEDNVEGYKLAYQDRQGDWLLAGDVPWGTFVRSVQRLKLLKKED